MVTGLLALSTRVESIAWTHIGMSAFFSEFEVNIVLLFVDDHLVTYNFPLLLMRF